MLYDLMRRMLGWEPPRLRRIQRAMGTTLPKPRSDRARCGRPAVVALSGLQRVPPGCGHTYDALLAAHVAVKGYYPAEIAMRHDRAPEFAGMFERSGLLLVGRTTEFDCKAIDIAMRLRLEKERQPRSSGSPVE